jgi:hypothetical protein
MTPADGVLRIELKRESRGYARRDRTKQEGLETEALSLQVSMVAGHATNIICSSGAPALDVRLRQVQPGFWAAALDDFRNWFLLSHIRQGFAMCIPATRQPSPAKQSAAG